MSTKFVQPGAVLTFTAPTGGVTSGVPVLIGRYFVIPQTTAAATVAFEGLVCGVNTLPKTGSQAWAMGQDVFWDIANARADSDPNIGPQIGVAAAAVGSGAGETTGAVNLCCCPIPREYTIRKRVAIADVNAGATLLPGRAGVKYRLLDALAIAVGGAVAAVTTIDLLGTVTTDRKLVAFGQAALTQNTVVRAGGTGGTVLADGASFTANDAGAGIKVGKTGSDATTATHVDFIFRVAEDQ